MMRPILTIPLALLSCTAALAASGTPIGSDTRITQPGRYVVTQDIVGTGLYAATLEIDSSAGPVSVDLGGYSITGHVFDPAISVIGMNPVTLLNGHLLATDFA